MSAEKTPLPTSAFGRGAGLLGGLVKASAKSLGRTVSRAVGREEKTEDIEPEAEVVASLGQLKGVVTKMGQVLGYVDIGLPDTLRSALSALHTNSQPVPADRIRAVLDADLGDPGRALGSAMEPRALSSASIGQVHRSKLPDGTDVVVKVRHPGLSKIIERDFAPALFASRVSDSVHGLIGNVRDRLLEECDYALEARRQRRFGEIFRAHPLVLVPDVHDDYCSERILTTTFVQGEHIDAFLAKNPDAAVKNRAGMALFDFFVAPLFKQGLYNCDPHPGNYLFTEDGRVAFVDFGSAREFEPGFVGRLAALSRAVMADDRDLIHEALVDLGLDERVSYDREATRWLLHAFYGPLAKDEVTAFDLAAEVKLREVLRSAWKARRLAVSGELFFLLRTFLGLSSALAKLGARTNWKQRLESHVSRAEIAWTKPPPLPAEKALVFDVVLVAPGSSQIALIRELRELTGKDLRELKDLMDSVPQTLRSGLPRAEAETLKSKLEAAGARVEVRRASPLT